MGDGLFIVRPPDCFGAARWQVVFAGHDFFAGLGFEFQADASGNLAAGLRGGLVFGHAGGDDGLGNLAGGKFGQGGEDEFGLAPVVAEVLGFWTRRSRVSALATSVRRSLPSSAAIFNW